MLPKHSDPSPVKPPEQVHLKDPTALLHIAFASHGCSAHSFTSILVQQPII